MKSKVITFPDIESIKLRPEQCVVERSDHKEEIESELDFIRRKHSVVAERAPGEAVEIGDALVMNVRCDAEGAPGKFNKEGVGISLGKNFYDRNLEAAIVGRPVGDTVQADAGKAGEWPVRAEIVSAQHTVTRELTDEDFKEEGILNDVVTNNEEEYLAFLEEAITDAENMNHFYDYILDDIAELFAEESEFEIDEAEYNEQIEKWYSDVRDLPDYLDSDEDIGFIEYVQDLVGSESTDREELTDLLMKFYDQGFKYNLVLFELAKDVPVPTREKYEAEIERMMTDGYTREELEASGGYDEYVKDKMLEAGQLALRDILERQYTN